MLACSALIFSSIISILVAMSPTGIAWSRCALLRKPKIPKLVTNINTSTEKTRYVFSAHGILRQLLYSQLAVTNLAISSVLAMMATGIAAAANSTIKPATEYQAATALSVNATNRTTKPIIIVIFMVLSPNQPYSFKILDTETAPFVDISNKHT